MGSGTPLGRLKAEVKRWLHLDEQGEEAIDFIGAIVASTKLAEGTALWGYLVGDSGVGKSALLSCFPSSDHIVAIEGMTPKSLISGFRGADGSDPSLAPRLDGKCLIDTDFTQVLEMPEVTRDELIGTLRVIYDGIASKHFGTVGLVEYHSRFAMIAATTPNITKFTSIKSVMGERFLMFHLRTMDETKVLEAARKNADRSTRMKEAMQVAGDCFLESVSKAGPRGIESEDRATFQRVSLLASCVARLRSRLSRNRDQNRSYEVEPFREVPSRLLKQFLQLLRAHALAEGRRKVALQDFGIVERVARDTVPHKPRTIARTLYTAQDWLTRDDLSKRSRISLTEVVSQLEDFGEFGVTEQKDGVLNGPGRPPKLVRMIPEFKAQLARAELFR